MIKYILLVRTKLKKKGIPVHIESAIESIRTGLGKNRMTMRITQFNSFLDQ